jgi:diguanylate cyclase (GGDEF)-like protein/PAS domain S-box-containing protein
MRRRKEQQSSATASDRYCAFFRQSLEAAYIGTPDGHIIEANEAWLDLFGYTREELPALQSSDLYVNPEQHAGLLQRLGEAGFVRDEVLYKRKSGAPFLCERSLVAARNESGEIVEVHGFNRDVSQARKAEAALKASADRYKSLFERSLDAHYIGTPEGRIIEVNQAWLDLFGYTREELTHLQAADLYANPEDRVDFARRMAEAGHVQDEVWYRRKDGSNFLCQRNQVALTDEAGNVIAFQGINRDVSQLRRAEAALRENEQKYRALFEQSLDAIYITTPDGASVEANQAWLDLFGYTREDLAGLNAAAIYADPVDREAFVRRMQQTGFVRDEVRYRRKDGTIFDAERTVAALKDPSGKVNLFQGVIRDITARKRADEALRQSEERNRSIVQVLPDLIIRLNTGGEFLDVIASASHKLAIPPDQIAGKTIADILPEADASRAMSALQETLRTNYPQSVEYPLELNSVVSWYEARFSPSGDDEVVALIRDVTERKNAERALAESERRYRELFEHSMDAISLVSPGGLLLAANQAWLRLFGYEDRDIGVANVEAIYIDPQDRTRLLQALADKGELVDDEVQLKRRDGTAMHCLRTVVVRRDAQGAMIGDQSVIRDITARKQAEAALRESEERFRAIFEQSMDAIYIGRLDGTIMDVNQAWLDLFGYSRDELPRISMVDLYVEPADRALFLRRMKSAGEVHDEVRFKRKDGAEFDCERTAVARRDHDGDVPVFQGIMRDVTQRNRDRAELERLARFDTLTGLMNRRTVLEKLDEWIAHQDRYGGALSVLMLDLDHFKQVNDVHGHAAGDTVLVTSAHLLVENTRRADVVGRHGGEEFLIILPRTDATGAEVIAERIRSAMENTPFAIQDEVSLSVTTSIGVAERGLQESANRLLARADAALYEAKRSGRNRVATAPVSDREQEPAPGD